MSDLALQKKLNIRAVVFAVSGRLGGTNEWDEAIGGPRLQLLYIHGLKQLAQAGVEFATTHSSASHARA